jgi:uncharacterized membrane protein
MRVGLLIAGIILIILGGGASLFLSNYTYMCHGGLGLLTSALSSDNGSTCAILNALVILGYALGFIGLVLLICGFSIPDKHKHKKDRENEGYEHHSDYNPKFCEECGHKLAGHERHCPECGHSIRG